MTKSQILKTLLKNGMNMEAVLNASRDEVEIFIDNGHGIADDKKTKKEITKAKKILGWKGGYYSGYGSLILQANPRDLGDWNDVSSRHHY